MSDEALKALARRLTPEATAVHDRVGLDAYRRAWLGRKGAQRSTPRVIEEILAELG